MRSRRGTRPQVDRISIYSCGALDCLSREPRTPRFWAGWFSIFCDGAVTSVSADSSNDDV